MEIDELSLNELLLLAEEISGWEELPAVHSSQSSINMANMVVLDHEFAVKAYMCKSSDVQIKISYEHRTYYKNPLFAARKAVSHHEFRISVVRGTVILKEFADSKIMRLYRQIELIYEK
ncbi:MAG: hypothetical protein Q7J54_07995 [Candidatus Woesearchaeota archaeon]|nr:hypothetical protein [Candidatus Woesearchaeota archaeon]